MSAPLLSAALLLVTVAASSPAAATDLEAGRRKAEPCARCHGADGNSTSPDFPSLAGQPTFYIHWQLVLFRDNRRRDPLMSPFAASLSDADVAELAAYFAAQRPKPPPVVRRDAEKIAAGQRVADTHHCASCHAPGFVGRDYIPRLTGLHYEYLLRQLRGFKARTRGELDGTMTTAVQPLTDADVENLAHYLASLAPPP